MKHHKNLKKLHRNPSHRLATLRNLSKALIIAERIETTLLMARALRRVAERLVTLGKRGGLANVRRVASFLNNDRILAAKLCGEIAPRFADRQGGYTRIIKLRQRRGDNAELALIEWVVRPEVKPAKGGEAAAGKDSDAGAEKASAKPAKAVAEKAPKAKPAKAVAEKAPKAKPAKAAKADKADKPAKKKPAKT